MKTIRVNEIPTLVSRLEEIEPGVSTIQDYIDEFQSDIAGMLAVEELFSPGDIEDDNGPFNNIHLCCIRMAHLVADLKAIHREVQAARLISEAGLKPKKGGAAQ